MMIDKQGNSADFHRCAEAMKLWNRYTACVYLCDHAFDFDDWSCHNSDKRKAHKAYKAHVRDCPDCVAMEVRE